jgi:hypothetical protein
MKNLASGLAAHRSIRGNHLGAVTFVQDYVQLAFDGPGLTVLTCPSVRVGNQLWEPGAPFYRDRLCEQITKIVSDVELTEEMIAIVFKDGSRIEVPLKIQEGCAESAIFSDPLSGCMMVWN